MDPLHVKKLVPNLVLHQNFSIHLYNQAVRAPTVEGELIIPRDYHVTAVPYLGRIFYRELYSLQQSGILDHHIAGCQIRIRSALRNETRSVEPQSVFFHVVLTQRNSFLTRQAGNGIFKRLVFYYVRIQLYIFLPNTCVY